MIIKQMDSLGARKLELEILKSKNLPKYKKERVNQEFRNLINGEKGEKNTAYYIDFDLKKSNNWAVIHDLRIEHDGEVAQIDHLLIGRLLDFYVLETKAFGDTLKMNEDETFLTIYKNEQYAIPSPVEQNGRHIRLLRSAIKQANILPKRLGITIPTKYHNIILLDPKTNFLRPNKANSNMVMKSDQFLTQVQKDVDKLVNILYAPLQLTKAISPSSLKKLAAKVASLHVKGGFNYKEYFGITNEDLNSDSTNITSNQEPQKTSNYCARCKADIPPNVAKFCFDQKHRFHGRAYCYNCQNNY